MPVLRFRWRLVRRRKNLADNMRSCAVNKDWCVKNNAPILCVTIWEIWIREGKKSALQPQFSICTRFLIGYECCTNAVQNSLLLEHIGEMMFWQGATRPGQHGIGRR
jgi:hypothetical protein